MIGIFFLGGRTLGPWISAAAYGTTYFSAVIFFFLFYMLGPANSPLAASLAIIIPFAVFPIVSLATVKPDEKLLDKAFEGR